MKNNSKHLRVMQAKILTIAVFVLANFFSNNSFAQEKKGAIEGFVSPKDASVYVEIILPHPKVAGDTIMKRINPDAKGFYKIDNLAEGSYTLIFTPKNPQYISSWKTVTVNSAKTASVGEMKLKKPGEKTE